MHKCLIHDEYWETTPNRTLGGVGCPKCHNERVSKSKTRTQEEYEEELREVNPNIIVLEKYIDCRTRIKHKCLIHDVIWEPYPDNVLKGCGCPKCGNEKIGMKCRTPYEIYEEQLKAVNPNIICIGEYRGVSNKVAHKCLLDDCEWEAIPSEILTGNNRCPKCEERINGKLKHTYSKTNHQNIHFKNKGSYGERQIAKFLNEYKITYNRQQRFVGCIDKRALPFDFYLPDYNAAIEYDGIQHTQPVEKWGGEAGLQMTIKHDNIKNEYCKNNGIRLLRIPYNKDIKTELDNFLFT